LTFTKEDANYRHRRMNGGKEEDQSSCAGKKVMSTQEDREVKKTVNSVLVTLDRCGRYELAATVVRKKLFVALINTPEIEAYSKHLKDEGLWQSTQHSSFGILIDTQIVVPEKYYDLETHAQQLALRFAEIEEWHRA
jgi:hypothetical protein